MTNSKSKYRAKHVYWDSIKQVVVTKEAAKVPCRNNTWEMPSHIYRFDSVHEFKVYLELVRMHGAENVLRQHKVSIIKPGVCYPNGKTWRVDFAIRYKQTYNYTHHLVEAKGAFLPEFASVLSRLEDNQNDLFWRTRIIFPGKLPEKNRLVNALLKSDFRKNLISLKELEKLSELP